MYLLHTFAEALLHTAHEQQALKGKGNMLGEKFMGTSIGTFWSFGLLITQGVFQPHRNPVYIKLCSLTTQCIYYQRYDGT